MFIPGEPVALGRHRSRVVVPKDGRPPWVQTYPDKKSADYEDYVGAEARRQVLQCEVQGQGLVDFTLPLKRVRVLTVIRFNVKKPVSYPKRVTYPTKKPDIDNLEKAVFDGLVKGGIIEDDALVTDALTSRRYVEPGHPLGVEIDLAAVPTETV